MKLGFFGFGVLLAITMLVIGCGAGRQALVITDTELPTEVDTLRDKWVFIYSYEARGFEAGERLFVFGQVRRDRVIRKAWGALKRPWLVNETLGTLMVVSGTINRSGGNVPKCSVLDTIPLGKSFARMHDTDPFVYAGDWSMGTNGDIRVGVMVENIHYIKPELFSTWELSGRLSDQREIILSADMLRYMQYIFEQGDTLRDCCWRVADNYDEAIEDFDKDSVCNGCDLCPETPPGCLVDPVNGCELDGDGDGVCDGLDQCPETQKGCRVSYDGCALDSDGDGVCDGLDLCPLLGDTCGGGLTAFGCPLPDDDGDGIPDCIDECPYTRDCCQPIDNHGCGYDKDGDGVCDGCDRCEKVPGDCPVNPDNGCPEDSDGDGVWDCRDDCPKTRKGCRVDMRGCAIDGDQDGVCDGIDQCPGTPEGLQTDEVGCPRAYKIEKELVLVGVNFNKNEYILTDQSKQELNKVVESLRALPHVKLEIQGHAAKGEKNPDQLSQKRAEAVSQYFISLRIDAKRVIPKGYGSRKPLQNNIKDARIELKRLN